MKKILGMFLAVSIVLSGIGAFAETASPAPTETPQVTVEPTVSPGTTVEPTETATTSAAEPTVKPTSTPTISENELSTQFVLNIDITSHKYIIPNDVTVELYSSFNYRKRISGYFFTKSYIQRSAISYGRKIQGKACFGTSFIEILR